MRNRAHADWFIFVDKSVNGNIIISTLQIVEPNLFVVVITTVSEGVGCCDCTIRGINLNLWYTPRIVRVSCNGLSVLINDSNYVALQVLDEVVGNIVINNSAYGLALSITCIYIISFLNRKVNKKLRTS